MPKKYFKVTYQEISTMETTIPAKSKQEAKSFVLSDGFVIDGKFKTFEHKVTFVEEVEKPELEEEQISFPEPFLEEE